MSLGIMRTITPLGAGISIKVALKVFLFKVTSTSSLFVGTSSEMRWQQGWWMQPNLGGSVVFIIGAVERVGLPSRRGPLRDSQTGLLASISR